MTWITKLKGYLFTETQAHNEIWLFKVLEISMLLGPKTQVLWGGHCNMKFICPCGLQTLKA
jgi:hypothetical protein